MGDHGSPSAKLPDVLTSVNRHSQRGSMDKKTKKEAHEHEKTLSFAAETALVEWVTAVYLYMHLQLHSMHR